MKKKLKDLKIGDRFTLYPLECGGSCPHEYVFMGDFAVLEGPGGKVIPIEPHEWEMEVDLSVPHQSHQQAHGL